MRRYTDLHVCGLKAVKLQRTSADVVQISANIVYAKISIIDIHALHDKSYGKQAAICCM